MSGPNPRRVIRPQTFEWCVRWRRRDWSNRQSRLFQFEHTAAAFAARVGTSPQTTRGPIVEVTLEHRAVSPWTTQQHTIPVTSNQKDNQ